MRIVCTRCATEYFLESDQLDRDGTPVQCSACEHVFTVYPGDTAQPAAPDADSQVAMAPPQTSTSGVIPPPPPSEASNRGLFLGQGDRIYKVRDFATLQRWVVEKRVLPGDQLSHDGKSWEVVSSRSELRPFFAVIEQLKVTKRSLSKVRKERDTFETEVQTRPVVNASPDTFADRGLDFSDPAGTSAIRFAGPSTGEPVKTEPLRTDGGSPPEIVVTSPSIDEASISAATDTLDSIASLVPGALPLGSVASASGAVTPADPRASLAPADTSLKVPVPDQLSSFPSMDSVSESISRFSVRSIDGLLNDATADPTRFPTEGLGDDDEFSSFFTGSAPYADETPEEVLPAGREPVADTVTRQVPVARPTDPPTEVGRAAAHLDSALRSTEAGGPARGNQPTTVTGERSVSYPDPSSPPGDFDPNQTFSAYQRGRPLTFLYALLSLLVLSIAFGVWHFMGGFGSKDGEYLYAEGGDAPPARVATAEATPSGTEAPEPSPTPDATPESAPTPEPTPKATRTPEPTPKATPKTTPKASPKPKTKTKGAAKKKGDAAFDRGDFTGAVKAYTQALKDNPKDAQSATRMGWAYIEKGDNSGAVKAFRNALGIDSGRAEPHYGLGLAYQSLGRADAAREEYQQYLRIQPSSGDAAEVRAMLRSLD